MGEFSSSSSRLLLWSTHSSGGASRAGGSGSCRDCPVPVPLLPSPLTHFFPVLTAAAAAAGVFPAALWTARLYLEPRGLHTSLSPSALNYLPFLLFYKNTLLPLDLQEKKSKSYSEET